MIIETEVVSQLPDAYAPWFTAKTDSTNTTSAIPTNTTIGPDSQTATKRQKIHNLKAEDTP